MLEDKKTTKYRTTPTEDNRRLLAKLDDAWLDNIGRVRDALALALARLSLRFYGRCFSDSWADETRKIAEQLGKR